jgi:RNA polymerase sigma-70 factor, ECF subfamily
MSGQLDIRGKLAFGSRPRTRIIFLKPVDAKSDLPSADDIARSLLSIATDRDRRAFAHLFAHFAPRLKAFHMRSGLSDTEAEELAQETMLTVWRKASFFDPARAAASTWIFTIARNQRIDRLRRERVQEAHHRFDPSDEPDAPSSGENILMTSERQERVRAALRNLSEEQAAIVKLSFYAEKPHAEIARELGIPLGTVKSRARLAFGRLRALLDGEL